MAKKVTLTEREITILLQVIGEYIEVFSEAEDTQEYTEYMLDTGLGSALRSCIKDGMGTRCTGTMYALGKGVHTLHLSSGNVIRIKRCRCLNRKE